MLTTEWIEIMTMWWCMEMMNEIAYLLQQMWSMVSPYSSLRYSIYRRSQAIEKDAKQYLYQTAHEAIDLLSSLWNEHTNWSLIELLALSVTPITLHYLSQWSEQRDISSIAHMLLEEIILDFSLYRRQKSIVKNKYNEKKMISIYPKKQTWC
jgi:hypothetical protein